MLDADMPEEPCNFAAVEEGGHDWHVVVTVFAFGDIDFEYLGEHFAPPIVLYGIVIGTVLFECEAFWMSGFRVMFLRCGEFDGKNPLHFTRWDFGGGMMALNFSTNSVGVNSRCDVPSEYPVFSFSFSFTLPDLVISRRSFERAAA